VFVGFVRVPGMYDVNGPTPRVHSFGRQLRSLRLRVNAKQLWLAREVGCSDAAVSFWETDRRFPHKAWIPRLLGAFRRSGARPDEIASLLNSWQKSAHERRSVTLPPSHSEDLPRSA
jgi:helix-turn-helix protein